MSLVMSARPLVPWRWLGLPALACVVGTVILAAPIDILGLRLPEPVFPLALSFAWASIRPSILGPFALLLLGLFLDLFWGGPPGLWAVSLLVSYVAVLVARGVMSGQGGGVSYFGYALTAALGFGVAYGLAMLVGLTQPNPLALFWQFLATSLLYPFARWLIERYEGADVRYR
jgi:rod shape-determining protein MreD